jgi:hypothetical protein
MRKITFRASNYTFGIFHRIKLNFEAFVVILNWQVRIVWRQNSNWLRERMTFIYSTKEFGVGGIDLSKVCQV